MAKGPSRCGELFLLRCACARVEATANGAKLRLSRLILLSRLLLTPVPAPSAILSLPGTGRMVETSQCEGTAKSPPQKSQQIYEGPPERPARLQNAMLLDSCDNHLVVQTLQYFFTQEEAIGRVQVPSQRTFVTRTSDTYRPNRVGLV